jgi:hypothetical protein
MTMARTHQEITKTLAGLLLAAKDHTDALIAAGIVSNDQLKYVFANRQARAEAVKQLAGEGMSTRKIAALIGVDHTTVVRDVAGANAPKSGANAPKPNKKNGKGKVGSATSCDFDFEHDKETEEEPDHVTRAHAFIWQTNEALRLAVHNALLRRGVTASEITPDVIAIVQNIIEAWKVLLVKLKQHQQKG